MRKTVEMWCVLDKFVDQLCSGRDYCRDLLLLHIADMLLEGIYDTSDLFFDALAEVMREDGYKFLDSEQPWRDFCIDEYRITFSIDDSGGVHFSIKRDDMCRGKT